MGSHSRPELWRFLVALGCSAERAVALSCDQTVTPADAVSKAFEDDNAPRPAFAVAQPQFEEIDGVVRLEVVNPQAQLAIDSLATLSEPQRIAVCAVHLLGVAKGDVASLGVDVLDVAAAEEGLRRFNPGCSVEEVLEPICSLEVPDCERDGFGRSWMPATGALIVLVLLLALSAAFRTPAPVASAPTTVSTPALAAEGVPSTESARPLVVTPSSTTTSTPVRQVNIEIGEENTIVRFDPETGDVIWVSLPLRMPEIVAVHPNTIQLTSSGRPVVMSLLDGTILPG